MAGHETSDGGREALPDTPGALPREFLESLSAELRTALNSMLGFAQLSLRDSREPLRERHKLRIAHVVAAGERLLRVLDDAILLSRIESGLVAFSPEASDLTASGSRGLGLTFCKLVLEAHGGLPHGS